MQKYLIIATLAVCAVNVSAITAPKSEMRVNRAAYRLAMGNVTDYIMALEEKYEISMENCTSEFDYDVAIIDKNFNRIINNTPKKGGGKMTSS